MRRMVLRVRPALAVVALMTAVVVTLAACGAGGGAQVTCATSDTLICTKSIQLDGSAQTVLATREGKTLYAYKLDTSSAVACTGPCALAWPPLTTSSSISASLVGLSGSLGVLAGGNGSQVMYNGHPLYSYSLDTGIADARGQGAEGGNWSAVTPDIAPLGAPAGPTPTSGDSYGY